MADEWIPSEAMHADAAVIATLFGISWTSPFNRLQFGYIDPPTLTAAMAPRIARQMGMPNALFCVIRDPVTQDVVAVAQWTLPLNGQEPNPACETAEEQDERQAFEDRVYKRNLPEKCNKDLIMEFTIGLRELRDSVLQGRKHYVLENLATHPRYRKQGLASRLIEWASLRADEENVLVYLDTASDNPASRMYRKLGFEEQGRHTIESLTDFVSEEELEKEHCANEHTHVAFIRYPKQS
ncbi:acyl-CoA N-acyltransferase [Phaeosphaeriaceae sp. PMI808]|nr:acyl-CoA N-acyltransferase [Phaeosphaeriaceae sp. PMI808]